MIFIVVMYYRNYKGTVAANRVERYINGFLFTSLGPIGDFMN